MPYDNFAMKKHAYYLQHYNVDTHGRINGRYKEPLLFKNNSGYTFCGNIHEHLVDRSCNPIKNIGLMGDVQVYHTGYADMTSLKEKFKRKSGTSGYLDIQLYQLSENTSIFK